MGRERPRVLGVMSIDPVMSVLAPVGLAASRVSSLVIDTQGQMGGGRTVSDMLVEGPRLAEVSPGRSGVAVLGSGHLPLEDLRVMAERLATRWPGVVVRLGPTAWDGPIVPVVPLYPGWLTPDGARTAVWQRVPSGSAPRGPGPVLPPLKASLVRRVLGGGHPGSGRWVRAWSPVWELPWG